jgi:glutamine amidotransferase
MKALVVNYSVGNIFSISSALKRVGFDVSVDDVNDLVGRDYDLIVFPGVGSFSTVARYVNSNAEILNELRGRGAYFLGICIGMHVMFEYGLEGGFNRGLGWFRGYVDLIRANVKLPHIGWDVVYVDYVDEVNEVIANQYVYFIHSYVAYTIDESYNTYSYYGIKFPALITKGNVVATQFHPEKSSKVGIKFLENLKRWLRR